MSGHAQQQQQGVQLGRRGMQAGLAGCSAAANSRWPALGTHLRSRCRARPAAAAAALLRRADCNRGGMEGPPSARGWWAGGRRAPGAAGPVCV